MEERIVHASALVQHYQVSLGNIALIVAPLVLPLDGPGVLTDPRQRLELHLVAACLLQHVDTAG